jgi:hypothetical protein
LATDGGDGAGVIAGDHLDCNARAATVGHGNMRGDDIFRRKGARLVPSDDGHRAKPLD